jgi:hypothetical protein
MEETAAKGYGRVYFAPTATELTNAFVDIAQGLPAILTD